MISVRVFERTLFYSSWELNNLFKWFIISCWAVTFKSVLALLNAVPFFLLLNKTSEQYDLKKVFFFSLQWINFLQRCIFQLFPWWGDSPLFMSKWTTSLSCLILTHKSLTQTHKEPHRVSAWPIKLDQLVLWFSSLTTYVHHTFFPFWSFNAF